ncbi:cytochrome P450 [Trichoderma citrinoviride]|uniref:Cytochrome P450 n=1 Tax=Trichoderma citrinoviride TaxID=58853 RepID=A0A2T4B739_9HYPO|nr:cytochrome P450 [Trichoderma citrinoviride]PTB65098.1 cytochrome P450 [Trichoderma citrinoviride]
MAFLTEKQVLLYVTYTVVYNLFFHPLRHFPGPKLWAIHHAFYVRLELSGEGHKLLIPLHQKYGSVVRVGPDHLSFCHPDAMNDLSGHRKANQPENGKEKNRVILLPGSIIGANREDHARLRKSMANGFSNQAMVDQQPLIMAYVEKLFAILDEECAKGEKIDMVQRYNWTTFDIIGDLAFGEPFGCLEHSTYHPWVAMIFDSVKNVAIDSSFRRIPLLYKVLVMLTPKAMLNKLKEHNELSEQKTRKRLDAVTDRKDFMAAMTSRTGKDLTLQELVANAALLIIAGSETTAAALTAATYYLCRNPVPLKKLCDEVRSSFTSEDEIDLLSVSRLNYMLAILDEALRLHPPVPGSMPRTINEKGDVIAGHWVPPGTNIDIWYWTMFHYPDFWTQPEDFIPERWLGDPRFANDQKQIFTPFSVGPRVCIGKNLAYAEMRLILAKLIWRYDIELLDESIGWDVKSKVYIGYQKPPLYIRLKPRAQKV